MAMVARLMGAERREYEKNGEKKVFCTLHLMHIEGSVKGIQGCKCENVSCPRDVEPRSLLLGGLYQLEYEIYEFKGEQRARLQDLLLVDEPKVDQSEKK